MDPRLSTQRPMWSRWTWPRAAAATLPSTSRVVDVLRRGVDHRFTLDLAAHLAEISTPPALPAGWRCEVALALANDAALGGDFAVFSRHAHLLRGMVVDTSGKGAAAATRATMLAGAVAGLLGEMPLDAVLPAVNRHVQRVGDVEHLATAVVFELDLASGRLLLGNAGHPPPARFDAGAGVWKQYDPTGPVLGVLPDEEWALHQDVLSDNDALIVVTDGVVEVPGTDLDLGVDRLLGQAEHLVLNGWAGGAQLLLDRRRHPGDDDAQVLLISRTPVGRAASAPPATRARVLADD